MSDDVNVDDFLNNFISGTYNCVNDIILSSNVCYLYIKRSQDTCMEDLENMMSMMKKAQFLSLNTSGFVDASYLDEVIDDPTTKAIMVNHKSDLENFDEIKEKMASTGRFLVCSKYDDDATCDELLKFLDHVWGVRKTNPDYL